VERYANEAVLPFYLLHQTVIVAIGFYVVPWHASALLKFLIISSTAFAITLLLYEVVIKRTRLTRFLFGMKSDTAPGL
jgi:peptidoglycan/LPS O-acetylase OafA/YrhL